MAQEHYLNGKPKGKAQYHLPTFGTQVDVRCFPLGYNLEKVQCGLEPNQSFFCDSPVCHINSTQQIQVLACFHTFHSACLPLDESCIICAAPLKSMAKELGQSFNKGLVNQHEDEQHEIIVSNDDENSKDLEISSAQEAEKYYNSQEWERKVNEIIATYENIRHPTKPNHHAQLQHSTSQTTSISPGPQMTVSPVQNGNNVISWHFPPTHSQSTLNGRSGSNACTFIALILTKLHLAAPEIPRANQPLSPTWIYRMLQGIEIGNKFYDSFSAANPGIMFGVKDAAQKVQRSVGITSVGPELPADIARQPVATANLPYHIELASMMYHTASLFIINQKTVAFVSMGQNILLLDSHFHGSSGAYLALAPKSSIWELLRWFKTFNGFHHSMGTVTNVSFT